ncbi:MAG TPA: GntR family transcriptional regulator [Longimicrobiaceae bacterium]|nr:GntR family transcriptional regulator [Longimicrobiaceae bacterium]
MLPFEVVLRPGESPYRQVVYAATRAVVSGELAPGSSFPSVRELSQALKINPNTAHKVVAQLVRDGILEVLPGIGTTVAEQRPSTPEERRLLLSDAVEHLVVEAKRLGLDEDEVLHAVSARWAELSGGGEASAPLEGGADAG